MSKAYPKPVYMFSPRTNENGLSHSSAYRIFRLPFGGIIYFLFICVIRPFGTSVISFQQTIQDKSQLINCAVGATHLLPLLRHYGPSF